MHVEAFEKLIEILKEVREHPNVKEKFNMGTWGYESKICGTVACACGWATLDNWFRRRNFIVDSYGNLSYRGYEGTLAAAKLFRVPYFVAGWLFLDEYNCTNNKGKQMIDRVIKRIEWILTDYNPNEDLNIQLRKLNKKQSIKLSLCN